MDKDILIAEFKKARESVSGADFNKTGAYIAMGHYDFVVFKRALRDAKQVPDVDERRFLPLEKNTIADAVGPSMYRFLVMINILNNDSTGENIKKTAQALMSQLKEYMNNGIDCSLYRSIDNCDIACIIDSDNFSGTLDAVKKCADSIDNPRAYFFTVPMLNTRILDEANSIKPAFFTEVPDTAFLVRTTVKEHKSIDELLSEKMLLKGLGKPSKYITFGANDIVIYMGNYSPSKVITYYRNVKRCFDDYLAVLYSAEVEILKKK